MFIDVTSDLMGVGPRIRDLLGHPAYTGHVQYIQGSSQTEKDLFRAKVHEAMAVLVLACGSELKWP